jgi:hypothetical protein
LPDAVDQIGFFFHTHGPYVEQQPTFMNSPNHCWIVGAQGACHGIRLIMPQCKGCTWQRFAWQRTTANRAGTANYLYQI